MKSKTPTVKPKVSASKPKVTPVKPKTSTTTKKVSKIVEEIPKTGVRDEAVKKFMYAMNKKFGINALMFACDITPFAQIKIPTGSLSLDIALGGGIPIGRFVHLSGAESSFKSTVTYHIIRNAQHMKKEIIIIKEDKSIKKSVPLRVLLIQSESGTFTAEYGEQLGVDVENLMFNQCEGMEEALEIALQAQKLGIADLICFDSFEGLTPTKEYDSTMMDSVQMGIKPKLFGEFFRKYCAINNRLLREGKQPCTIVGINQLREKIGQYGDPLYSPGGGALKFHASIEVRFRKGDVIKVGKGVNEYIAGQNIKFKVNKNKVAVPMRAGNFDIYFDDGGPVPKGFVDIYKEVVLEGLMYDLIDKKGGWYSYGTLKVQGEEALINAFKADKLMYKELSKKLIELINEDDEDIVGNEVIDDDDIEEDF